VIDDSEVETPGDCHLETWVTDTSVDTLHLNAGLGCTPEAVPTLELGVFAGHTSVPGSDETVIGVTPKLTLRPAETGLGIAVAGSLGYGIDRSRLETASLIGAITVPATESLNINVNAGWVWTKAGVGSELFVGAQAEWAVTPSFTVVAEGFTRNHDKAGGQAGVRWTPGGRWVDFDLLAARYGDGATPTSVTVGLTIRH